MAGKRRKVKVKKKILKHGMKRKLVVMYFIITLALLLLLVRIAYIQHDNGQTYAKTVLNQQEYNSRSIPFKRGDITDCKGTLLATSVDVYNVILDCKVVNSGKKEKYVGPTARALAQCFDVTEEEVRQILKERPSSQYYVLKKRLPYEEIQAFEELMEDTKNNPDIKGVWFEKEYIREYPFSTLASAVLGFTTTGNEGISGLENYYNSTLNGTNGREYGYLNEDSNVEKTIIDAENGSNLVLTIDGTIQAAVEEKILQFNETYRNNFYEGDGSLDTGVIIMDPNSGGILAMADYPNYDLNNPWDLSKYYTEEAIAAMSEEEKLDELNKIWQNYCVTSTFEPGSTIKPFTVAAGLETGLLSGDEVYLCDGVESVGGHDIHCSNRSGHGMETIEKALMDSCNDALMQMAYVIGKEILAKYLDVFNFGLRTNIDLPGEARTDTLVYTAENMDMATLATNSFGQNFNATMIQVAAGFSSLINGGYYYQPHVVKKIVDANGNTIKEAGTELLKETVSKTTSDKLREYLYKVTSEEGTGNIAKVEGYSLGGKTGTAQKQPRADKKYLISFIGYAPQEDPQLVIYVVINEPNMEDQAHSSYAQQLAHDILQEILPYMNIYQDEEVEDKGGDPAEENPQEGDPAGENPQEDDPAGENPQEGDFAGENPQEGDPAGDSPPEGTEDVPDAVPQTPEGQDPAQPGQDPDDLLDTMEEETGQREPIVNP